MCTVLHPLPIVLVLKYTQCVGKLIFITRDDLDTIYRTRGTNAAKNLN